MAVTTPRARPGSTRRLARALDGKRCTRQFHQTHQANRVVNENKMNASPIAAQTTSGTKMRSTLVSGVETALYVTRFTPFAAPLLRVISRYHHFASDSREPRGYGRGMRR